MGQRQTLKVATWNVNSVRARLDRVVGWLERHRPDVVLVQEVKATDETFPWDAVRQGGYEVSLFGQPTYNGVALFHRAAASELETGFDDEARMLAATVSGIRFINVYVPNGQRPGSAKHAYKTEWLATLRAFVSAQQERYGRVLVAGDFNVAPERIDVAHPEAWHESVLTDGASREGFEGLIALGLEDVFREHQPGPGQYTWWDYRTDGFAWNDGLRIDHLLASPALCRDSVSAWVDYAERAGERPSDHAPVLARFLVDAGG